jgi:hypothetical protein
VWFACGAAQQLHVGVRRFYAADPFGNRVELTG